MYIVIAGDLLHGIHQVVGPFATEGEAESYMDSHNMGHFDKFVFELTGPPGRDE